MEDLMHSVLPEHLIAALEGVGDVVGVPVSVAAAALVAALVALPVALCSCRRGTSRPAPSRNVVIVGECGSGKTVLMHRLLHGTTPDTVSSMDPCVRVGTLAAEADDPSAAPYRFVDFPGHKRLRGGLDPFVATAGVVLFLVDATAVSGATVRNAAEFLFEVLSMKAVEEHAPAVFVVCTKSDVDGALSPDGVKAALAQQLSQLAFDGDKTDWDALPVPVHFLAASATSAEGAAPVLDALLEVGSE